jgi:hypothetical protein
VLQSTRPRSFPSPTGECFAPSNSPRTSTRGQVKGRSPAVLPPCEDRQQPIRLITAPCLEDPLMRKPDRCRPRCNAMDQVARPRGLYTLESGAIPRNLATTPWISQQAAAPCTGSVLRKGGVVHAGPHASDRRIHTQETEGAVGLKLGR